MLVFRLARIRVVIADWSRPGRDAGPYPARDVPLVGPVRDWWFCHLVAVAYRRALNVDGAVGSVGGGWFFPVVRLMLYCVTIADWSRPGPASSLVEELCRDPDLFESGQGRPPSSRTSARQAGPYPARDVPLVGSVWDWWFSHLAAVAYRRAIDVDGGLVWVGVLFYAGGVVGARWVAV